MPVSEKQLAANRRNAAKSTGPRTDAGKLISRFNGQTHGLTGQSIFLDPEEQNDHDRRIADYIAALQPESAIETELATLVAEAFFRLRRSAAVEQNIYALGHPDLNPDWHEHTDLSHEFKVALGSAQSFLSNSRQIGLLSLYEQRIGNAMRKNMVTLKAMQSERKAAREAALEKAELLAQASYAEGKPYDPTADFPVENGFGFSTEQINDSIHKKRRYREALKMFFSRPDFQPELIERKTGQILNKRNPELTLACAA